MGLASCLALGFLMQRLVSIERRPASPPLVRVVEQSLEGRLAGRVTERRTVAGPRESVTLHMRLLAGLPGRRLVAEIEPLLWKAAAKQGRVPDEIRFAIGDDDGGPEELLVFERPRSCDPPGDRPHRVTPGARPPAAR